MATRKPRIEYKWRSRFDEEHEEVQEVTWSLYGANGEYMCGSGSEGYRDKTDARRSIYRVCDIFSGDILWSIDAGYVKEVGPGKRPE